ncbi:hypothetical protein D5086_020679 [Populus alba]|uniref:Uncharacterized protein n=1 Tax=Populus alba TaxID=43335 RepID=A0ACC4BLD7_POPAL
MDGEKTKEYILKWQVYLFLVNFSCYPSFCNAFCNQLIIPMIYCNQSYDGGFGMIPGSESHGGGTYCAVASLHLMGFIEHDVQSKSAASSISGIPLYGAYRGKQLRVDSKGELTSLVTLYILVCVRTPPRRSRRKRLFICALTRAACLYRVGAVLSKFPDELPDLYHDTLHSAFLEEPGQNALSVELGIAGFAALGI